jgi:hypothetical protein
MKTGIVLLASARLAAADPDLVATSVEADHPSSSLVYVEALGKAGPYGVGYEHAITERISLGFEGSADRLREQNLATAVPYVHVTPLRHGPHALFGELGVEFAYSKIESGVARWMGTSSTAIGGVAAAGYQRDFGKRFVLRIALEVLAGKGGAAPWGGISFGAKL